MALLPDASPYREPSEKYTVAQVLFRATQILSAEGTFSSPRLDAEVLLSHAAGWTRTEIHTRLTDQLPASFARLFWDLLEKRREGVPVAYLIGWREFYSRRFKVAPSVLIPRPETEFLVEHALELLEQTPGPTTALDLCCGSGCIGITLALETLSTSLVCSDVSDEALHLTSENVAYFGLEERVEVRRSDLFSALNKQAFDLIVSNPPYVGTEFGPRPEPEVDRYEPGLALYSGRYGTDHLIEIVKRAPLYLIEGGSLVVECASFQAETVEAWMVDIGFQQTCLWHDLSGLPRGVSGRWEG